MDQTSTGSIFIEEDNLDNDFKGAQIVVGYFLNCLGYKNQKTLGIEVRNFIRSSISRD